MSPEDKIMTYLANIYQKMTDMDNRLINVEKIVIHIENDHGQKLKALFDGYDRLRQGQEDLSLKVEQNTQATKALEERVATQEIKMQLIK